jgi:hypothetical protein
MKVQTTIINNQFKPQYFYPDINFLWRLKMAFLLNYASGCDPNRFGSLLDIWHLQEEIHVWRDNIIRLKNCNMQVVFSCSKPAEA